MVTGNVLPRAIGFAFVVILTLGEGRAEAASFTPIGEPPFFSTEAHGVSADGSVVVGREQSLRSSEAFRWSAQTGLEGLGFLYTLTDDKWSRGMGVSGDGSVAVGASLSRPSRPSVSSPFRWTADTGMVGLTNNSRGSASGASFDGSVIVGTLNLFSTGTNQAYRWGTRTGSLGDLDGGRNESVANDVSSDGSVIVGWGTSDSGREAFRWTSQTGMVGLGDLPGGRFSSLASAASADGSVIVGSAATDESDVRPEAFRWQSETGMVALGDLPGGLFGSRALDVSADGSIVVGTSWSDNGLEATIWDEDHGLRSLTQVLTRAGVDLTDWRLVEASGVSADGSVIIGNGWTRDGAPVGWVAVIPEPGTVSLLFILGSPLLLKRAGNTA